MKVAILGAGRIAETMAKTINGLSDFEAYAVGSRDLKKSSNFKEKFGFKVAYGSYEELVSDPLIDLVYVATPHSLHFEHMKLCLNNNKNVLCEKAFTTNKNQAMEVIELAKSKNLFVGEGIWTRYLPMRKNIEDVISTGVIGEILNVSANLGYAIKNDDRLTNPELSGGALLDLGVYVLNFASMILGDNIKNISTFATMTNTGVDSQNSITITYNDSNAIAILNSSMIAKTDRSGVIAGDLGYIKLDNINNYERLGVYNLDDVLIKEIFPEPQITGFEYELQSAKRAISQGKIEPDEMKHSEIIEIMGTMDKIREIWGLKYPCE